MTEKLRPCPFCAGDKISVSVSGNHICIKCGATAFPWSDRPIESALEARVRELESELAQARAAAEKLAGHLVCNIGCEDGCPIDDTGACDKGYSCKSTLLKWAYAPAEVEG